MPVCLLGMHRSGTSMITRLLNLCGLYLGEADDMIEAAPDNPKGYWENKYFTEFNDEVLQVLGGSWNEPPTLHTGWQNQEQVSSFYSRVPGLIHEFRDFSIWGWKDPRNSLTLALWQKAIPDLKLVICIRSPLEVAQSFNERKMWSSLTYDAALSLWLNYTQTTAATRDNSQYIITHFATFFYDAESELRRLAEFIGLDINDAVVQDAIEGIDINLRHQINYNPPVLKSLLPPIINQHYQALCAEAGPIFTKMTNDRDYQFGVLESSLKQLASSAAQAQHFESLAANREAENQQLRTQIAELQQLKEGYKTDVAALQPTNTDLARQNQELHNKYNNNQAEFDNILILNQKQSEQLVLSQLQSLQYEQERDTLNHMTTQYLAQIEHLTHVIQHYDHHSVESVQDIHIDSVKIVAYTSCSINYLAKARVFAKTLRETTPDVKIVLCLNDRIPAWFNQEEEPFDQVLHPSDYGLENADQWIFKHNVMELCTAVKGIALCYLMDNYEADLYLYFDPDCYVFNSPKILHDYMGYASVGLAPHILSPEDTKDGIEYTEISVLKHGIYNLGFLAVRNDDYGRQFAEWWRDRTLEYCYIDHERGLFTDQRWVDLAPAIFPFVRILRRSNLNLASWNFYNRKITVINNSSFLVDGEPLIFYHFSGVGPNSIHRWMRDKFVSGNGAISEIERLYESAIDEHGQQELESYPFAYSFYSNGEPVQQEHRTLYRSAPDLISNFPNPFDVVPGTLSLWEWMNNHFSDVAPFQNSKRSVDETISRLFDANFYLGLYPDASETIQRGEYKSALDHYLQIGWTQGHNPNPFFDSSFYWSEAENLDIYILELNVFQRNPLEHFVRVGIYQGHCPSLYFNNVWYEATFQDVGQAVKRGIYSCGFEHYLLHGASEGRSPGPEFNEQAYVQDNQDVAAAIANGTVICGYAHYLLHGRAENRQVR